MARKRSTPAARPRLLLEETFQRQLSRFGPYDACEDLNNALRRNRARLWCNGTLVSPQYIRDEGLYVQVEPDSAGAWHCTIKSPKGFEPGADGKPVVYTWEVEEIEVTELPPSRRGRLRKHDWARIAGQIVEACVKNGRVCVPKSDAGVARTVNDRWYQQRGEHISDGDLREYVRWICSALRKVG